MPPEFRNDRARRPYADAQPRIIIFNSNARHHPRRQPMLKKPKAAAPPPGFAFINVSRPDEEDEDSRRLIKTHAMQHVLRRAEEQKTGSSNMGYPLPIQEEQPLNSPHFRSKAWLMRNSPQVPPSNLIIYPIQIQPYMLRLLYNYAAMMLPADANFGEASWFPLVMTDAALFHALICTSALFTYDTSEVGLMDSSIQRKHMLEAIRLINARLPGDEATSDATITTILFMAKAEHFQGNYNAWRIHMTGVQRIVELRGGASMLSRLVQEKIYTTGLLASINNVARPDFPFVSVPSPIPSL